MNIRQIIRNFQYYRLYLHVKQLLLSEIGFGIFKAFKLF